jgi:hypothetical protein
LTLREDFRGVVFPDGAGFLKHLGHRGDVAGAVPPHAPGSTSHY